MTRGKTDSMEPEFKEGELVIVNPHVEAKANDYVVVKNDEEEATFKQLKIYGETTVLHPLNPKYPDIEIKKVAPGLSHAFEPGKTPAVLKKYESQPDWKLPALAIKYPRCSVDRIAAHIELSLTELLQRADEEIGRAAAEIEQKVTGAEGRLAQAETRHTELLSRRDKRRQDLDRQRSLSLQAVERLTSVLILPHPERESPAMRRLRPNFETEAIAMKVVMEHEQNQGRQVYDVLEKNLGYDITSLDLGSGELRLIEVKGLGAGTGTILLTPNERRVAEDQRECYWLYVVSNCSNEPQLQEPIRDPARFSWNEVTKVAHYYLSVDAMTQPMQVKEDQTPYGGNRNEIF